MKTRQEIISYIHSSEFKKGPDYSDSPHSNEQNKKSVLLKGGAEKICDFAGCRSRTSLIRMNEDHERGFCAYIAQSIVVNPDQVKDIIGEAFGSCTSYESKYRYRSAKASCPLCDAQALMNSKRSPGKMYCLPARGGCGQESDKQGGLAKEDNKDVTDQFNTILKMAQKRAFVSAVLNAFALSSEFTVDISEEEDDEPATKPASDTAKPAPTATTTKPAAPSRAASLAPSYPKSTSVMPLKFLPESHTVTEEDAQAFIMAGSMNGYNASEAPAFKNGAQYSHELVKICASSTKGESANAVVVRNIFDKYSKDGFAPRDIVELLINGVGDYPNLAAMLDDTSAKWLE